MPIDLHTHSTVSDGSETPTEVVRRAAATGLDAVALTDHDILDGLPEARLAAQAHGIELIPGTELSLDWSGMVDSADAMGGMHLLVLWLEDTPGPLQDRLADLRTARDGRNAEILVRLADLGLPVTADEVAAKAGTGSVGRPHIAAVMMDRGYVPDVGTAFDLFLGQGRPAYVPRARLQPEVAIDLARQSGGVPVLAHPFTLGFEDDRHLEGLVERLAAFGLVGLESHHSRTEPDRRRILNRMAARLGLVPSGGSDFHGTYKPGIEVGVGLGDLAVPTEFLEELRRHRQAVP